MGERQAHRHARTHTHSERILSRCAPDSVTDKIFLCTTSASTSTLAQAQLRVFVEPFAQTTRLPTSPLPLPCCYLHSGSLCIWRDRNFEAGENRASIERINLVVLRNVGGAVSQDNNSAIVTPRTRQGSREQKPRYDAMLLGYNFS